MSNVILDVKNLTVFTTKHKRRINILNEVSFKLIKGHCLGLVGGSGCGKTIACKAILGVLDSNFYVNGDVFFDSKPILDNNKKMIRGIRGKEICMIVQSPMTSFDPLYRIGSQMIETFVENLNTTRKEAKELSIEALEKMNVENILEKYPHELSGGMLQRVMIGIVLILKPKIIIADEPTTAVDAINVLNIIKEFLIIKETLNTSMIFISHDLGVVSKIADDLVIMKDGEVMEMGETHKILSNPVNDDTRYLINTRNALINKFNSCMNISNNNIEEK